jgi:two-component system, NarL family, nitrate/nitrite response regulator NarL
MSLSHAEQNQPFAMDAPDSSTVRVHICGRPLFAQGLKQIFEGTGFAVFDCASSDPLEPCSMDALIHDLFVLDGNSCPAELIEQLAGLKANNPQARFIVLSDQLDGRTIRAICDAGVDGICLTSSSAEVLLRSVELVMLGEVIVSSELLLTMISTLESCTDPEPEPAIDEIFKPAPRRLLSNREVEVLNWLKEGAPNKVIARHLNVAEATVKVHVKAILKKIRVSNRAQAAIWAAHHMPLEVVDSRSPA